MRCAGAMMRARIAWPQHQIAFCSIRPTGPGPAALNIRSSLASWKKTASSGTRCGAATIDAARQPSTISSCSSGPRAPEAGSPARPSNHLPPGRHEADSANKPSRTGLLSTGSRRDPSVHVVLNPRHLPGPGGGLPRLCRRLPLGVLTWVYGRRCGARSRAAGVRRAGGLRRNGAPEAPAQAGRPAACRSMADRHQSLKIPKEFGAPGEIRTPNPQIRSLVLYPIELRAQPRPGI